MEKLTAKSITMEGEEFLTRLGVEDEFHITKSSFYRILTSRKMRFTVHPSFGRCVKREWVMDYFNNQRNFK